MLDKIQCVNIRVYRPQSICSFRTASKENEQVENTKLPDWLCPVQVRLIPVAEKHLSRCLEIASQIRVRVGIDNRKETVGRKVREAEVNWIPFVGMVGDKEIENQTIAVR